VPAVVGSSVSEQRVVDQHTGPVIALSRLDLPALV